MLDQLKTGIELELWVVDSTGKLCDGSAISEGHDRIESEFVDPLLEVRTEPHADARALERDLQTTLATAIREAATRDMHLVPLGTPLTASDCRSNCVRGHLFEIIYGGLASARNCAGTHIHFEQSDVRNQLNVLTALDPALALVSTSPYYLGSAGADSSRARAYRTACDPAFREFCDLWSYTDSVDAWRDRVDEAYERFTRLARDRGVPEETVERFFTPENTVLNPVRLRESQPTVEWRAPDATLPSRILQLAADVARLVAQARSKPITYGEPGVRRESIVLPTFPELRELSDAAIESGLDHPDVRSYLRRMGFDPSAYDPLSPRIHGSASLTEREACRLRLAQACRLREDVAAMSDSTVPATNSAT